MDALKFFILCEKWDQACFTHPVGFGPSTLLHSLGRSQPVGKCSNTYTTPELNFQKRVSDSLGALKHPLICGFQTIAEDAGQLHKVSTGKEAGICPLAWENWPSVMKCIAFLRSFVRLHKSQGINQAGRESSCVGLSAGAEKTLRPPRAPQSAAGSHTGCWTQRSSGFYITFLPLT